MEIKHTPGPWRINLYLGGAYAIDHVAPNGDHIARVAVVDGLVETPANARLIATAPDLLDLLEEIERENYRGIGGISQHYERGERIRALIARAKTGKVYPKDDGESV